MSLLEQMWDDTVAGPRPDSGLGKLRKHRTFGFRSATGNDSDGGGSVKSYGGGGDEAAGAAAPEEMTRVTRSIMIVRPPGYQSGSTPPVSPAGSTPPVSPFSGSSRGSFRFRRRSASDAAFEKDATAIGSPVGTRSSSSPYDV